jgi:predicted amidohydrolase
MQLVLVQPQLAFEPAAHNARHVRELLLAANLELEPEDVVLLPEGFYLSPADQYCAELSDLARTLGCHVVGGSHHEPQGAGYVNAGRVFGPDGSSRMRYEKLRPYANEREWVRPGSALGMVEIGGRNVLVLICADFWFSDVFLRAPKNPDLVLVPALSVTRKSGPEYSRSLWRHLAIERAYEFGTYVGVSDWAHTSRLPALATSGVAGFADPTTPLPDQLFLPLGDQSIRVFQLDFAALDAFREDRRARGFFWQAPG